MIGLVVVSHGTLATELVRAAGIIVGKIEGIVAVDISPDMSVEAIHDALAILEPETLNLGALLAAYARLVDGHLAERARRRDSRYTARRREG